MKRLGFAGWQALIQALGYLLLATSFIKEELGKSFLLVLGVQVALIVISIVMMIIENRRD